MKKNILLYFILSTIIASSLWSSDLFIYKSLTSYFSYLTGIAFLLIYSGIILIEKNKAKIYFGVPVWLTIGLVIYILVHTYFLNGALHPYAFYIVGNACFMIALSTLLVLCPASHNTIYVLILIAGGVESVICICQFFGWLKALNHYFVVTGSWGNPNVTAMFLAMVTPTIAILFNKKRTRIRRLAWFVLLLLTSALLVLQCRTALIGAVVAAVIILTVKYNIFIKIQEQKNRSLVIMFVSFFLAISVSVIKYIYYLKAASASGRILIWKLALSMALEKPFWGYGYGSFERNYNLFQSQYFKAGNGTATELRNAGFVKMAYNELLQNLVEGGLVGLFLLVSIWIAILRVPIKNKSLMIQGVDHKFYLLVAYAGLILFMVMSLTNFSLQAIPVMCVFNIYAAILLSGYSQERLKPRMLFDIADRKKIFSSLIGAVFLLSGALIAYKALTNAKACLSVKQAVVQQRGGHAQSAVVTLQELPTLLAIYESYWTSYGNVLFAERDYQHAIARYLHARTLSSDPEIYRNLGLCYMHEGDYVKAKSNLDIAKNIEPNRLINRYALMKLYLRMGDTMQTFQEAQGITAVIPRIKSQQSKFYQELALKVMKDFKLPKPGSVKLKGSSIHHIKIPKSEFYD